MIRSKDDRKQYFRINKPLNAKFNQSPEPQIEKVKQLNNYNSMPYIMVPQENI